MIWLLLSCTWLLQSALAVDRRHSLQNSLEHSANLTTRFDVSGIFTKFNVNLLHPAVVTEQEIEELMCLCRKFAVGPGTVVDHWGTTNIATDYAQWCDQNVWNANGASVFTLQSPGTINIALQNGNNRLTGYNDIEWVGNEYVINEALHALWWTTPLNGHQRHVVAFRHQESDDDTLYALKRYNYAGAALHTQMYLPGKHKIPHWITAIGGFAEREGKSTKKYTTIAKAFIKGLVNARFNAGDELIVTGYSLGGGVAQAYGLSTNANPQATAVITFAGNGPITTGKRINTNAAAPPMLNIVGREDITSRMGCFGANTQVCVLRCPTQHEGFVYGQGPEDLRTAFAVAAPGGPASDADLLTGLWCMDGTAYSKLCGICEKQSGSADITIYPTGSTRRNAAKELLKANYATPLCEWAPEILTRKGIV